MPRYRVTRYKPTWERESVEVVADDYTDAANAASAASERGDTEYRDAEVPDDASGYASTWEAEYLPDPHEAKEPRQLVAIPCTDCHPIGSPGVSVCGRLKITMPDGRDARLPRELAYLAASGPELADALEALMRAVSPPGMVGSVLTRTPIYNEAARVLRAARTGVGLTIDARA